MKWLPNWLTPWWLAPAPGADRGVKVYAADGREITEDPQWSSEVLEQAARDNLPPAAPNRVPPYKRQG